MHSTSVFWCFLVQCAKCGRQHTVWSGRHTQIGRLTRGFVDLWIGKSVDLWIRGFRETRESLKITQISVSLLNRPQSHWSDEIEKQSITWKVKSVNGEPSQSILQFWHLQYTAYSLFPCAKSEMCSRQKAVWRRCSLKVNIGSSTLCLNLDNCSTLQFFCISCV